MDTIRSQFFWRGAGNNFKYHMIRWDQLCLPKNFGGIGILNTRLLNDALLLKWVWRILAQRIGDLCYQLLRPKYLHNKTLMNSKNRTCSQFWKGIQTVKYKIRFGLGFKVHNGRDTIFWDDVWLTNVPLRLDFLEIYIKCRKKDDWVRDLWDGEAWSIPLCRTLVSSNLPAWDKLMDQLEAVQLHSDSEPNTPIWLLKKYGTYTTKSNFRFLSYGGVTNFLGSWLPDYH